MHVSRDDFLKAYLGSELDPLWLNRVSKLSAKGWKSLVAKDKDKIKQHRHHIHALAGEIGLEIGEFRKIVHMVSQRFGGGVPTDERGHLRCTLYNQ